MAKERHGFITFWLWFMIIVNLAAGIANFAMSDGQAHGIVIGCLGLVNMASAVCLLNWKKIGFWIFVGVATCSCILNIYLESFSGAIGAVMGVCILFGILQLKKNNQSCWSLLE